MYSAKSWNKDLYIISRSTVAGEKEKQGPLGKFFDYYYLDPSVLASLGIKNVNSNGKDGYYIVAYSLDDTYPNTIEVINTKGYRGIYTLTELMAI